MAPRTDWPDFLRIGNCGYRLLENARLSREERQIVLAGTTNDTEHEAVVTQLRSARDDEDLRDRDRRGKSFGMGRTDHFAQTDTEWYAEEIAHSISGDGAEVEVTWSFDPDEAVWWCGVLDTRQFLNLTGGIGLKTGLFNNHHCALKTRVLSRVKHWLWFHLKMWHLPNVFDKHKRGQPKLIEHWLRLDRRWRRRNKIVVVSSLLPMLLPVEKAKARASSKET